MVRNHLKIVWRNLAKYRSISLIQVFGLGAGMAAFLLIARYVSSELSFDRFHAHADHIYRLRLDDYKKNVLTNSSVISYHADTPQHVSR